MWNVCTYDQHELTLSNAFLRNNLGTNTDNFRWGYFFNGLYFYCSGQLWTIALWSFFVKCVIFILFHPTGDHPTGWRWLSRHVTVRHLFRTSAKSCYNVTSDNEMCVFRTRCTKHKSWSVKRSFWLFPDCATIPNAEQYGQDMDVDSSTTWPMIMNMTVHASVNGEVVHGFGYKTIHLVYTFTGIFSNSSLEDWIPVHVFPFGYNCDILHYKHTVLQ